MTGKNNAGQDTRFNNMSACDVGLQELEARLLLSGSGLVPYDHAGMIDNHDAHDEHSTIHGIENPEDDHGDDAINATFVQTDTTIIGDIEVAIDQDWFKFTGQAGITYTFETELLGLTDTSLTLYDSDGVTPIAFDDDSGPGLASVLSWTASTQGEYYIVVRGFDVLTGAYSISMSDTAIPTGEIRGTKWDDINQDGIRDLDEPGLEGWVIFIDENRNRRREPDEKFVITDENGDYVFENMRPGTYTIAERPKPGWEQTAPGEDATATSSPLPDNVVVTSDKPSDGFVTPGEKWDQPGGLGSTVTITYSYSNLLDGNLPGGLEPAEIQQAIEEALNLWASFAPLKFVYVEDSGLLPDDDDTSYPAADHADIRFGHHAIDGESGVLAHAYYPFGTGLSGDVHFDNGDAWSIGPGGNSFDLIEVAVHEIGHSLGIHHEPQPPAGNDAIMNPFYGERYNGFGTSFLLDDDVAAVQNLYGEVQSLLGVWTVTIVNPGEFVEDIDFGSFLNDDFGSDAENSEPVDSPSFIQGNIESYGDIDWFSFEAEVGQSFSFETLLGDGDIEDTIIRLLDQDGNVLLGTDDDGGVKLASKLPWIAPAAGTYYIEVSGYNANVGTYTLRIAAAPPGDLDVDGFVGVNDLQIILAHWNQNVPVGNVLMGDPSFDGFVGIDDLNLVLGNWNAGNQNAAANQQAASTQEETATVSQTSASTEAQQADQQAQTQTAQAVVATGQQTQRAQTAQRQRVRQADRPSQQVDQTRNAIAAWSRQPVQQAASTPFVSPVNMTDSDESEGLLGLWSRDEDA